MWLSVDGSKPGVLDMTLPCGPLWSSGSPSRPNPGHCSAAIEPLGRPDSSYASPYAGLGTYAALEKLPANPAALLDYIQKYYATGYAGQIAAQQAAGGPVMVGSMAAWDFSWMRSTLDFVAVLPPRLGAALFQALARIPGVYLIPHVTDYAGRPGMAVAMTSYGQRQELIFDPNTYQYLGSQTVLTQSLPVCGRRERSFRRSHC
ncbi:MAG: CU044_5270 family protein [Streptosporangiaceae bacterium]|nr:CU044_5270 family protein [Streptosporangiaceae bacterium]